MDFGAKFWPANWNQICSPRRPTQRGVHLSRQAHATRWASQADRGARLQLPNRLDGTKGRCRQPFAETAGPSATIGSLKNLSGVARDMAPDQGHRDG
jgi:hypothetical protein